MPPTMRATTVEPIGDLEHGHWCDHCKMPSAVRRPFAIYPPLTAWTVTVCMRCHTKSTEKVADGGPA